MVNRFESVEVVGCSDPDTGAGGRPRGGIRIRQMTNQEIYDDPIEIVVNTTNWQRPYTGDPGGIKRGKTRLYREKALPPSYEGGM